MKENIEKEEKKDVCKSHYGIEILSRCRRLSDRLLTVVAEKREEIKSFRQKLSGRRRSTRRLTSLLVT